MREGAFIPMQTSLEAGLRVGPVAAVGSIGRPDRERRIHGDITRFYFLGTLTDELQLKVGRFVPAFGINLAHHMLPTRGSLGFGFESERNTAEVHWSGESWHGAASVSKSRLESRVVEEEKAISVQAEKFLADSYRVGVSLWSGESERQRRWLWSVHGILGFTESFYNLTEFTWQSKRSTQAGSDRETGLFHFSRLGYEVLKGLHIIAVEELAKSDLSQADSLAASYGAGALWYPRPHLEFEFLFNQRKRLQVSKEFEDYAYLLFHYYF